MDPTAVLAKYTTDYEASIADPVQYWRSFADRLIWDRKWNNILDDSDPPRYKWFAGGKLNMCYNCLDRHIEEGRGDIVILPYYSANTDEEKNITYNHLIEPVSKLAGYLVSIGIKTGSIVYITMPEVEEAVVAMLACCRIGAIHIVDTVMPGSSTKQVIASRFTIYKPQAVIVANVQFDGPTPFNLKELVDEAMKFANYQVKNCIVLQRKNLPPANLEPHRDVEWDVALSRSASHPCVPVDSNHPLCIVMTSGTTSTAKGIVLQTAGVAVALSSMLENSSNQPPIVSSRMGWSLGQMSWGYLATLKGSPFVFFEGNFFSTPDASTVFRLVEKFNVGLVRGSAAAMRAVRAKVGFPCYCPFTVLRDTAGSPDTLEGAEDPDGELAKQFNLSGLIAVSVTGERTDDLTFRWIEKTFGVPCFDSWSQTELNGAGIGNFYGLHKLSHPKKRCTGIAMKGWLWKVLREDGSEADPNETGILCAKFAALLSAVYNNEEKFMEYFTNFPGYYNSNDYATKDEKGCFRILYRADNMVKMGGSNYFLTEIEQSALKHPEVTECVAARMPDPELTSILLVLYILREETAKPDSIVRKEIVDLILNDHNTKFPFTCTYRVDALPTTATGKVARGQVLKMVQNHLPEVDRYSGGDKDKYIMERLKKAGYIKH